MQVVGLVTTSTNMPAVGISWKIKKKKKKLLALTHLHKIYNVFGHKKNVISKKSI